MLSLEKRIDLLDRLGKYMLSDEEEWEEIKYRAMSANSWFTKEHIQLSVNNIAREFLNGDKLRDWVSACKMPEHPKKLGIVLAGNIPLVGFHDFLCGFITGHEIHLKPSSKDEVLIRHIIAKLTEWEPQVAEQVHITDSLKNLDAYIATGSNNTARYFEQYFAKYPHIIRKNKTSVAVLEGNETDEELRELAKDVFAYFGLGCRNVTQVNIPEGYDLGQLLKIFGEYDHYILHNKYKNNYDYYLTIYLMNKIPYLSNDSLLMVQNEVPFSAVSVLHYRYYKDMQQLAKELQESDDIQTVVGRGFTPFGTAQQPALDDYPDGVDTMAFLCGL